MMSRKALVIVGLAAIIAASTGVAFASDHHKDFSSLNLTDTASSAVSDSNDTSSAPSFSDGDDTAEISDLTQENTVDNTAETDADTAQTDAPANDTDDSDERGKTPVQVTPSASFQLLRVVEQATSSEQPPRVLFGRFANSCYMTLNSDCTIEVCLNPAAGTVLKGTYTIAGDTMYVDYGEASLTEYQVVFTDNMAIESVIVPFNGYDVYFG